MQYIYIEDKNAVMLSDIEDFDPVKIFESGQCFRWNADKDGVYTGVAFNKVCKVWAEQGKIYIGGSLKDFEETWFDYFDLSRDYALLRNTLITDEYTKKAADYGRGIRLLKQDRWEALCSFIISQCNNIPRIKKIIEALCRLFGEEISFEGGTYYGFPSADRLSVLEAEALAPLKCGYRAAYIIAAARAVAAGELNLDTLAAAEYETALNSLKSCQGIGDKVANCMILYGLHMHRAFPIDTWIRKALDTYYPKGFNPASFGEAAGLAQQYIFYYIRETVNK
jgi:N-glycosylase/DNA lyase